MNRTRPLRLLFAVLLLLVGGQAFAGVPAVTVIDVHGSLWPGQVAWIVTQMDNAWKAGASGIILDFDCVDGPYSSSESAAQTLKSAILSRARTLPIAGFVHDRALGPGVLAAIACRPLALAPGGSLGGAGGTNLSEDLRAAAEATGRNPAVAAAFVSADAPLPALGVKAGDTLTLTAKQAQLSGYADVVASDYPDVLAKMGLAGASLSPVHISTWTAVALWVAQPWASVLLLALGLALIVAEMVTWHSWGIAGVIGGALVLLIMAAHITAGDASWVGVTLFLLGIALLLFETHIFPGHGLSALAGLVLIFFGMYYALGGARTGALYSAGAALLTSVAVVTAFFVYLPRSGVWKTLGQPMRQSASAGYVSSDDYTGLLGQIGEAVTLLRPSGTAEFAGLRVAVVSEGDFISQGSPVQVVLVQGSRVVVRGALE